MPDPVALLRGKAVNQSLLTTANYDIIAECSGENELVVNGRMTAGAAGDLTVQVNPVMSDGVVSPNALPSIRTDSDLLSGKSYVTAQYDVSGYDRVRIRANNANAGTQTLELLEWKLVG